MLKPTGCTNMIGRQPRHSLCRQCIPHYNLKPIIRSYVQMNKTNMTAYINSGNLKPTSLLCSSMDKTNSSVSLKTACKEWRFKHLINMIEIQLSVLIAEGMARYMQGRGIRLNSQKIWVSHHLFTWGTCTSKSKNGSICNVQSQR